jgi:hypothetical protein
MNFETWARTQRKAVAVINEFSQMGIPIPSGPGTPRDMSTLEVLASQTVRAFDHAIEGDLVDQGFGFRGRSAVNDDEIPEDDEQRDDESDTDRKCREAAHRVLDRLIDGRRTRKRSGRRATDLERQEMQTMASILPLHNSLPPWAGRAADADADEGTDLQHYRELAFESCGCM